MDNKLSLFSVGVLLSVLLISGCTSQATGQVATLPEDQVSSQLPSSSIQEVNLRAGQIAYTPDRIVVKKGIPVRINVQADANAGCTRSIVFPDFGINKVIPRGGSDIIEFTPTKAGTYQFRCAMNMARGTLVVTG